MLGHGFAGFGGANILPDNCVVVRISGFRVPQNGCFPLVCDANCRDSCRGKLEIIEHGGNGGLNAGPNLIGGMLDPSVFWENLLDLFAGEAQDVPFGVHNERPGGGGSLVNDKNQWLGHGVPN